jgi:hypothetical protein
MLSPVPAAALSPPARGLSQLFYVLIQKELLAIHILESTYDISVLA